MAAQNDDCSEDASKDYREAGMDKNEGPLQRETKLYISFACATTATVESTKITWVVDAAVIDTGSIVLASVRVFLRPTVRVSNIHNDEPFLHQKQCRISGVSSSVQTIGTLNIYFHFGVERVFWYSKNCPGIDSTHHLS